MAKQYANRSDLRNPAKKIAVQTPPSSQYGEATQLREAQQAVPMASSPTATVASTPAPAVRPRPGQLGPLDRPTERPTEPVTAGAPFGPGRMGGPTAYVGPRNNDPVLDELRALYSMYPSEDLADMLDSYIREGY